MSEVYLHLYCELPNAGLREQVERFLDQDERPFEAGEVDEPFRDLFAAFEDIEFPEFMEPRAEIGLECQFTLSGLTGDEEMDAIVQALVQAGVTKLSAHYYDDEESEAYYMLKDSELHELFNSADEITIEEARTKLNVTEAEALDFIYRLSNG